MAKIINSDVLSHYHGKMKQYVKDYVANNALAQTDLRSDTSGTYSLKPNVLYLLPDTGSTEAGINISIEEPKAGVARKWEAIMKYTGGDVKFADGIDVSLATKFYPNTYYSVEIIDGHASIKAVGNPGQLYLFNVDAEDPQCTDVSGGWMLAPNAGAYRLYSSSGNSTVFQVTGSGIKNQCYRNSSGDGYGGGMTANSIDFNALRAAGYTNIYLQIALQDNGSSQTQSVYAITGTARAASVVNFSIDNLGGCYGSYEHSGPDIITTQAIRVELPIPAADSGYVGYLVHNNNSGGLKTSYVKRVWIE